MQGSLLEIVPNLVTALIGVYGLSLGASGFLSHRLSVVERVFAMAAGIAMVVPGAVTDIIGIAILAVIILLDLRFRKTHAAELAAKKAELEKREIHLDAEDLDVLEHIEEKAENYENDVE